MFCVNEYCVLTRDFCRSGRRQCAREMALLLSKLVEQWGSYSLRCLCGGNGCIDVLNFDVKAGKDSSVATSLVI